MLDGGEDSNLRDMIFFVENELERFQLFWNIMDDFDSNVWVLEPKSKSLFDSSPNRHQRTLFVHVKINPSNQKGYVNSISWEKLPSLSRCSKLHRNEAWATRITEKFTALLGMEFPDPKVSADLNFQVECGVCYSYRRKANASVGKRTYVLEQIEMLPFTFQISFVMRVGAFHQLCVSEWLQSVPSTRRSFNMLFGSCPYCNAAVSVPLTINIYKYICF